MPREEAGPVSPGPGGPSSTTSMISSSPWKSNAPGPSAGSMPTCPRTPPRRHSYYFRRSAPPRPIPAHRSPLLANPSPRLHLRPRPFLQHDKRFPAPRGALWEMQFFIPPLQRHPPAAPARRTASPVMQRGPGSPARSSMAAALGGLRGKDGQRAGGGPGVPRRDSPRLTVSRAAPGAAGSQPHPAHESSSRTHALPWLSHAPFCLPRPSFGYARPAGAGVRVGQGSGQQGRRVSSSCHTFLSPLSLQGSWQWPGGGLRDDRAATDLRGHPRHRGHQSQRGSSPRGWSTSPRGRRARTP